MAFTREELDQIHAMRTADRERCMREAEAWNAAPVGYVETETVYGIAYRKDSDPQWYSAAPFYTPVRPNPCETHDQAEAEQVAALVLLHERAVSHQSRPGAVNVTAVRIVERVNTAKILKELK
jgi:hypothetical protein